MPSLQALEEFKSSFRYFGDETQTLIDFDLPSNDLPLPEYEPALVSGSSQMADLAEINKAQPETVPETDPVDFGDLNSLFGDETPTTGKDDLGFESFLDTIPTNIEPTESPEEDDIFQDFEALISPIAFQETEDSHEVDNSYEADDGQEANFSHEMDTPPDLLNGLAGEIEAAETDSDLEDLGDPGLDRSDLDTGDFDLGDLPGFDSPDSSSGDFSDFDFGDMEVDSGREADTPPELLDGLAGEIETADTDSGFGDLGDLGLEISGFDSEESMEPLGEGELGESFGGSIDQPPEEDNFGFREEDFDSEAILEEIPGDSFDNFSVGSDSLAGDFGLDNEGESGFGVGFDKSDEDAFSEMESVFDDSPISSKTGKSSGFRVRSNRREADDSREADGIEEITLTSEELELFLTTLSSYPLNLRIACEELIAEQAVEPQKMSRLVNYLIMGVPATEAAVLAGDILGRTIPIPKDSEKKTGESLEAEQASFSYIFVHRFLPILGIFMAISIVLLCTGYLIWHFIYNPVRANRIYRHGLERIAAGEYSRANERFNEAFRIHQRASWFFEYARAFRDARQFTLAEEKYQQLLYFTASRHRRGIPDKQAVLEYADLLTNFMGNFQMADQVIRRNILDFSPRDRDALIALGDNALAWGQYEPERLEDAREAFAIVIEQHGRTDPLLERMLKFFIRTDNLGEVIALQHHFMASANRIISAATLAELGGYLLDKKMEEVRGVPDQFLDSIGGIRNVLLRAIRHDPLLPESYFQLARYYQFFNSYHDERMTLELAIRVFDAVGEETPQRIGFHINALRRYAELLVSRRDFFLAEEYLLRAARIYQDALSRRVLTRSPEFGRVFSDLGDLEFFVRGGNMQNALTYYHLGELHGWAPPEIQYRMGVAYYMLRQWGPAQDRLFAAYREMQPNRRILYALGNVSFMRGNYFAAQAYFDRLLDLLNEDRVRIPVITPTDDVRHLDLAERLMVTQNNLGVTLEALAERTGNNNFRSRAQGLYADSERAWDIVTRHPVTMSRLRPSPDIYYAPGINPAFLNIQNSFNPQPGFEPFFFIRIDMDVLEPSEWEELAPPQFSLSEGLFTGRL